MKRRHRIGGLRTVPCWYFCRVSGRSASYRSAEPTAA